MKIKDSFNMQMVAVILLSLFAFTAQSSDVAEICNDPVASICSDNSFRQDARSAYLQAKKEIKKEAEKSAEVRISKMKKEIPAIKVFKRMAAKAKIKNEEVLKAAKKVLGELESVSTSKSDVEKIKNYVYQSIDQSSFLPELKKTFKEVVKNVTVGNYGDFLETIEKNANAHNENFENLCGEDGLLENAFALNLKEGEGYKRYVLICPGLIVNLKLIKDQRERFNSVLFVLAHELTHHIDSSRFYDNVYKDYLNCVSNNFSSKLRTGKNAEKICMAKGKNSDECRDEIASGHSREMIADEWANRVLDFHAKSEQMNILQLSKMLTDTHVRFCGSMDEGIHPSASFRLLNSIYDPAISESLNCDHRNKVTCSFDGQVTL